MSLAYRGGAMRYSPEFVEWGFSEVGLPLYGVLSTLPNKLCEVHTHRLSQSVLRIGSQSVLFRGSAIVPTRLSFLSRAPKKVPTYIEKVPTYIDKVMRLGGERNTHKQAYSPECVEGKFCEVPPSGLPLCPSNRMARVQFGL